MEKETGMNHLSRPYVPDRHDRDLLRARHPLGEVGAVRPPWCAEPPNTGSVRPPGYSEPSSTPRLAAPQHHELRMLRTPPSHEDILALWRLSGGDETYMAKVLARRWGIRLEDVWCHPDTSPAASPPSRARTEPMSRSPSSRLSRVEGDRSYTGLPPRSAPPWPIAPREARAPRPPALAPTPEQGDFDALSDFMAER